MKSKTVKIAILDSGVNLEHKKFIGRTIKGKRICNDPYLGVLISEDYNDDIGHGTAIYDIISSMSKDADITNYKILSNDLSIEEKDFVAILRYLEKNFYYDIINISISTSKYNEEMKTICDTLAEKGTIVVSSFENFGSASYPAAFASVVGVDVSESVIRVDQYEYVDGSIVNLRGRGGPFRVAWTSPPYILAKGSSYTCAYLSAYIANIMQKSRLETIQMLKKQSYKQFDFLTEPMCKVPFEIHNAVLFPFNKEIHALARFSQYLEFNIIDICDLKYSGLVGASTSFLLGGLDKNYIVKDIFEVDFSNVDTLVLGHMERYLSVMHNEIGKKILQIAIDNNLNIYSFDDLNTFNVKCTIDSEKVYTPKLVKENLVHNFGKLYQYSKPILCVVGTSSRQGKFSLQLTLRQKFLECGYKVGQIGTEPSALLFGMDYVFPSGYHSSIPYDSWDILVCVNNLINALCIEDNDVIITGLQGTVLPYNKRNANFYPFLQQVYLQAVEPDGIVLCVNPDDDIDYIGECIKYCESVTEGKVIAIVCFPMELKKSWRGMIGIQEPLNKEKYLRVRERLIKYYNIPVYFLGDMLDIQSLANDIIDYFTE